ncbi:dephospho-CoA kinase [Macrococcus sp. DPC7161]|uniref:dephospho-CoA kinase n=1 Tax=Macrococcus sp. DPC7161 TaxID=2507060 RepID=UPI00100A7F4A|nr:dephospho-CoA kinase [Macrococcus sp. DPC7161]RXK18217.1 dephospho-CoA kinase [Macrococcus sp. DPC7161]
MKVIGLTGGIATGKSTVSAYLKKKGFPIVDADIAARKAVEKGSDGLNQIVATFGKSILMHDQSLDRAKLGAIIFADSQKREQLNQIVHPIVREIMEKEKNKALKHHEYVIMDIPLLFENQLQNTVDEVWLVYTSENIQLERLMRRNHLTESEALIRIKSQMPIDEKRNLADVVIDNNLEIEYLYHQIDQVIQERTTLNV